ncbi:LAQU0S06e00650g1_1 [Lachancea quebecensis]|uniref:LAQU0S06e00650g1_1 n=1 Tax=Lachancea quebecensis TaxID=1654605 RepID=A0A0P1KTU7_9SACH|nr:LAQU0S06e00650g1_1 [Lachancea quebecensis]
MAEFSSSDYDTRNYSEARPRYPVEFFELLRSYHVGRRDLLVDVGCGPGSFSLELKQTLGFGKLEGTDLSARMIERANTEISGKKVENVKFSVHAAEDLDWLSANSVDMITAAQCSHWLDFPAFQKAAHRVLRPQGTLAIWGYVDPVIIECPQADSFLEEFQYSISSLGPYWENPGRDKLRTLLRCQVIDRDSYSDIVQATYRIRSAAEAHCNVRPLVMVKKMTLLDFEHYVKSWSAYSTWKSQNPKSSDLCKEFLRRLRLKSGLDSSSTFTVAWNSVYKFAKKRI